MLDVYVLPADVTVLMYVLFGLVDRKVLLGSVDDIVVFVLVAGVKVLLSVLWTEAVGLADALGTGVVVLWGEAVVLLLHLQHPQPHPRLRLLLPGGSRGGGGGLGGGPLLPPGG